MIAHGFAYHWPLAAKVVVFVVYCAVTLPLGIAICNWAFRDYRRVIVALTCFLLLYAYGLASGEREWWYVPMVLVLVGSVATFSVKWTEEGPKPKDPTQLHPFRWIYRKVKARA